MRHDRHRRCAAGHSARQAPRIARPGTCRLAATRKASARRPGRLACASARWLARISAPPAADRRRTTRRRPHSDRFQPHRGPPERWPAVDSAWLVPLRRPEPDLSVIAGDKVLAARSDSVDLGPDRNRHQIDIELRYRMVWPRGVSGTGKWWFTGPVTTLID